MTRLVVRPDLAVGLVTLLMLALIFGHDQREARRYDREERARRERREREEREPPCP